MNIFADWKFWLFVIAIINILVTLVSFLTIKFNDLRHLEADVKELKTDFKEHTSKVNDTDKELAVQKQRIDDLEKSIT